MGLAVEVSKMANAMTPEEAIGAEESVFRTYLVLQLQAISINCANRCRAEGQNATAIQDLRKLIESGRNKVTAILAQALVSGIVAVLVTLVTMHFQRG